MSRFFWRTFSSRGVRRRVWDVTRRRRQGLERFRKTILGSRGRRLLERAQGQHAVGTPEKVVIALRRSARLDATGQDEIVLSPEGQGENPEQEALEPGMHTSLH